MRLHALCEPDGVPDRGVVHVEVVADRADDDVAGVQSEANVEREPVIGIEPVRVPCDGSGEVKRRVTRAARVILVRDRRAEQRHHPVTRELVDRALEAEARPRRGRRGSRS